MWVQLIFLLVLGEVLSADLDETDDSSRKILGSSVVTSVSVILDSGNGNKASFADAVGKPVAKPQMAKLASPIELLNPDRYEFYTFDESGDLVKRLMTMDEIKAIIATSGDDVFNIDNFSDIIPENRVNDIVNNVQNVLREEIEAHKMPDTNQLFDTPDVSDSWSMILPAIFGNSGDEIKAEKTATASTPETLVIGTTQTETTMTKSTSTTPTTTISPISSFTNYFTHPTSTDAPHNEDRISAKATTTSHVGLSTSTISSSNRNITTTKFVSSKPPSYNTTPTEASNKMSTTTESNILKVQIFPNSNTNSESPYITSSTGGTQPDSEYVRISTPRPQPLLQSRISSTILEKTSPSIFTRVTAGLTTKLSLPQATTLPIQSTKSPVRIPTQTSSLSTKSTGSPTSTNIQPDVKINSTNFVRLTSQTIIEPTTEKGNKIYDTSVLPSNDDSTISQPTEKIYILLRPLTSTTRTTHISTKPTSQSSHTTPSKTTINDKITSYAENDFETFNSNESTSTKSIFTIISEKPSITVIPVTPQTISHFENNLTSAQPDFQYASTVSDSDINSYNETSQPTSLQTEGNVVTTITAETLYKDSSSKNVNSTNYTVQTTPSNSYKQQDVANVSPSSASTTSDLQNTGSLFKNKHTSITSTQSDYSITKTTELTPYNIETEKTSSNDPQTTEPFSTFMGIQKDILEKLLLSSTNVYEINSAVTQDLTYPAETTSLSGEMSTDYPSSESISPVEVNPTLIESLGQLLAQAVANVSDIIPENAKLNNQYGNDPLGSTTTSKVESFDPSSNFYQPTTYLQNYESTKSSIDAGNTEEELIKTTENEYAGGNTLLNKFNNFDDQHVINISIFKNQNSSKPAKADLSLEIDYDLLSVNQTEMQKLSTGISDAPSFDSKISTQATTLAASTPNIENEFTNYFNLNTSSATTHEDHYTLSTLDRTTNSNAEYTTHLDETAATEKSTEGPTTSVTTPTMNSTRSSPSLNESDDSWTLVSTIAPHGKVPTIERKPTLAPILEPTPTVNLEVNPMQGFGLEESTAKLDADVYQFVQLCNELAFGFWKSVTTGISSARSVIVSPFAATSLLAMVFLGARGSTSGEMNEILKLDNMVTFNPHLTFKSVTESILTGPDTGVATSAIVRQLYSDRSKEKILNFYKERAKFFYDGHVEEVSFKAVGDTIRRRTNLLIKKHTNGKIQEFLKDGSVRVRPPLAAISGSVMQTDCTKGSINERDGEIHFVVFPSIKQKRLIPIPAIVYREGFLAGYEPSLDATAVALGDKDNTISFIFVLPGRQGINALGDGLSRLEKRLVESSFQKGAWARLLRSLVPRPELEVQIPRFSHRSIINATAALKHMGLTTLFDINKADLRGLNGVAHDLHLSDMLQFNHFSLCGNANTGHGHHSEYYPATARRSLRKHRRLDQFEQQKILHDDPLYIINYLSLPLNLRPRQARVPQIPRLRLDRPFLYFVRHNPTGFILHMGRFNPRLIP